MCCVCDCGNIGSVIYCGVLTRAMADASTSTGKRRRDGSPRREQRQTVGGDAGAGKAALDEELLVYMQPSREDAEKLLAKGITSLKGLFEAVRATCRAGINTGRQGIAHAVPRGMLLLWLKSNVSIDTRLTVSEAVRDGVLAAGGTRPKEWLGYIEREFRHAQPSMPPSQQLVAPPPLQSRPPSYYDRSAQHDSYYRSALPQPPQPAPLPYHYEEANASMYAPPPPPPPPPQHHSYHRAPPPPAPPAATALTARDAAFLAELEGGHPPPPPGARGGPHLPPPPYQHRPLQYEYPPANEYSAPSARGHPMPAHVHAHGHHAPPPPPHPSSHLPPPLPPRYSNEPPHSAHYAPPHLSDRDAAFLAELEGGHNARRQRYH